MKNIINIIINYRPCLIGEYLSLNYECLPCAVNIYFYIYRLNLNNI
jgi:hypothetical protein